MTDAMRAWITALRSGEYTQGVGQLINPYANEYCCLGVACDVLDEPRGADGFFHIARKLLPTRATITLGMQSDNGVVSWRDRGDCEISLTMLNDSITEPCSFDQIADCLEYEFGGPA